MGEGQTQSLTYKGQAETNTDLFTAANTITYLFLLIYRALRLSEREKPSVLSMLGVAHIIFTGLNF